MVYILKLVLFYIQKLGQSYIRNQHKQSHIDRPIHWYPKKIGFDYGWWVYIHTRATQIFQVYTRQYSMSIIDP